MRKATRERIERAADRAGRTFQEQLELLLELAFTMENRTQEFERLIEHFKQRKLAETQ